MNRVVVGAARHVGALAGRVAGGGWEDAHDESLLLEAQARRIIRLETALKWYAENERYVGPTPEVLFDIGEYARVALRPENESS